MALPIAHAAAGYLVHRAGRRVPEWAGWRGAAALMLVGNLPDADFLVGFVLGRPGMLHRGFSHTILAAALFGVAVGVLVRTFQGRRFTPAALLFGGAYLSHLLLDWLTIDTRPPAGGQFLWPFSSAYLASPVTIFTEIHIDGRTRESFLASVVNWPTVRVLAREVVIAALAIGTWLGLERLRAARERPFVLVGGRREEDLA